METLHSFGDLNQSNITEKILAGNDKVPNRAQKMGKCNYVTVAETAKLDDQVNKDNNAFKTIPVQQKKNIEQQKINYGKESETVEFKTSFFYMKDGNETDQAWVIMKEICAFFNAEGGTIYLGVDDEGNVKGLIDDIKRLEKEYGSYKLRGKKFNYWGEDGYIRWIQKNINEKIINGNKYDIKMNYDSNGVLEIVVPKGESVVELANHEAFIRRNNMCHHLDSEERQKLQMKRFNEAQMSELEKKGVEFFKIIKKARNCKKRIVLRNYSSSHSKTIKDRKVEAFSWSDNYKTIDAYDVETGRCQTFLLCRIGNVEILDEDWEYESRHSRSNLDVFGMFVNDNEKEDVEIELSLSAKQQLVEQHPIAESGIKKESDNQYVLTTTTYAFNGIGRFCMGLLDEIQIRKGDGLRAYIRRQINKFYPIYYSA